MKTIRCQVLEELWITNKGKSMSVGQCHDLTHTPAELSVLSVVCVGEHPHSENYWVFMCLTSCGLRIWDKQCQWAMH
jgi:hypothetical protein